jgi:hypothetical protein
LESETIALSSGYLRLAAVGCPTLRVPVNDAEQIVRVWERYRDENGIGASDMQNGCGDLIATDGTIVARISYNGRIWDVCGRRIY